MSETRAGWILVWYACAIKQPEQHLNKATTEGLEAIRKEQKLILNTEIIVMTRVVFLVNGIASTYISFIPVLASHSNFNILLSSSIVHHYLSLTNDTLIFGTALIIDHPPIG